MATDMNTDAHQDAREGQQTPSPAGVASVPALDAAAVLASHTPDYGSNPSLYGWSVVCEACDQLWEPDGCEAVLLALRVALLEGLLRDLVTKGEAMKEAFFTGDDTREAIACMEWDDAVGAALADGG